MIKLPFVSRKKYDIARKNLKVMTETKGEVYKQFVAVQEEYASLLNNNREIGNVVDLLAAERDDLKKEVKYLKALCTKNGIEYKKKKVK